MRGLIRKQGTCQNRGNPDERLCKGTQVLSGIEAGKSGWKQQKGMHAAVEGSQKTGPRRF
ncbi:MAG: hypothetical protein HY895_03015 [Deltaproteobacteria bacterium]|nr:hypothetical protein [Deltaproteobacteria bacterium]